MAKLKAPLLSLGAAGKLGDALVFFGWKGLDAVRTYVVPANPNTTAQQTQRNYLKACVAAIHTSEALPVGGFDADDATSFSLLGSIYPTPRTWFNAIVKQWLDQKRASLIPIIYAAGSCTAAVLKATLKMESTCESSLLTNGFIHYGTSKTSLSHTLDCTRAQLAAGREVSPLSAGVKYYFQFRPSLPVGFLGSNSGIWHATPTAS